MTNEAKHNPQSTPNPANPETKVEKMFEYGYRKSNYGPDELVTDAHGNPISVVDAMLSAKDAAIVGEGYGVDLGRKCALRDCGNGDDGEKVLDLHGWFSFHMV